MAPNIFIHSKYIFFWERIIYTVLGREKDLYSSKYDNFILLNNLNRVISNAFLEQFCRSYFKKPY